MKDILEDVKHEMADVVKLNIFVKNISDIDTISEVLKTFFPKFNSGRKNCSSC